MSVPNVAEVLDQFDPLASAARCPPDLVAAVAAQAPFAPPQRCALVLKVRFPSSPSLAHAHPPRSPRPSRQNDQIAKNWIRIEFFIPEGYYYSRTLYSLLPSLERIRVMCCVWCSGAGTTWGRRWRS